MNTDQPTPTDPAQDTTRSEYEDFSSLFEVMNCAGCTCYSDPEGSCEYCTKQESLLKLAERAYSERNAALQQVRDLRAALTELSAAVYANSLAQIHWNCCKADYSPQNHESVDAMNAATFSQDTAERRVKTAMGAAHAALVKTEGVV